MKSFRSTLIFFALAVLIGGFATWDYFQSKKKDEIQKKEALVFSASSDEVKLISVQSEADSFTIEKEDGTEGFKLVEPLKDRIDQETLQFWLNDLLNESAKTLSSGPNIEWINYDLEPIKRKIKIETFTGDRVEVGVSDLSAFDGSLYLRRGDDLLLGGTSWARITTKKSDELRDKKLIRPPFDFNHLNQVSWQNGSSSKFVLSRDENSGWVIPVHKDWTVGSAEVESFIREIKSMRVLKILSNESDPAQLKMYNLHRAYQEVDFQFKHENDILELKLKVAPIDKKDTEEPNYALMVSDRPFIYEMSKRSFEQLFPPAQRFRDREQPFNVDLVGANKIRWSTDQKESAKIEKIDGEWSATLKADTDEFDASKTETFIKKIQSLKAKEFRSNKEWEQTGEQEHKVELFNEDLLLLNIAWKRLSEQEYLVRTSQMETEIAVVEGWRIQDVLEAWPMEKISQPDSDEGEMSGSVD